MFFLVGFLILVNMTALVFWPVAPFALGLDYLFVRSMRKHARTVESRRARARRRRAIASM